MKVYQVEQIRESNHNYEEPLDVLKLISDDNEKVVELPDSEIKKLGIREGKKVTFTSDGKLLKYIRVVAAVIRDDSKETKRIFATARGYGEYRGWWEFPGGKIENGETPQEALVREIREELTAKISVGDLIKTIEYDYPDFHLSMDCFWAEVESGHLELKEAEDAKWLTASTLNDVNWLPADQELIELVKQSI